MKLFNVTIEGTSALLQHRFSEDVEAQSKKNTRRVQIKSETPREAAEKVCYRDAKGNLYLPGPCISRMIREAGAGHKQRGSRKSLKYVIAGAVSVTTETIELFNLDQKHKLNDFEVDSRPVVIPSTKGRIMRHRPRLDEWVAKFTLRVNEDLIDPQTAQQLLVEGGVQLGIGDFRPEKGGPFGTFNVVEWKEVV